jgi:hypothetical protein
MPAYLDLLWVERIYPEYHRALGGRNSFCACQRYYQNTCTGIFKPGDAVINVIRHTHAGHRWKKRERWRTECFMLQWPLAVIKREENEANRLAEWANWHELHPYIAGPAGNEQARGRPHVVEDIADRAKRTLLLARLRKTQQEFKLLTPRLTPQQRLVRDARIRERVINIELDLQSVGGLP